MWKPLCRAMVGMALVVGVLVATPTGPANAAGYYEFATATNLDGRAEIFWVGSGNAVWHQWANTPGGPTNSADASLGGHVTSGIGVARNSDGRLEIFARADGGDLNHMYQLWPGGSWSGWSTLGGQIKPYSGVYAFYYSSSQTITVQVTGIDGYLHTKRQLHPNCCWNSVWE